MNKTIKIENIPNNWTVLRLDDLCFQRVESISPNMKGDLVFVGLEHIRSGQTWLMLPEEKGTVRSTKSKFYTGDILYGKLRPYLNKAVISNSAGVCSTDLLVLHNKKESVISDFLIYTLHSKKFINYAVATTTGTNHPRTSWKAISNFMVLLPPLPEQKKIAEILSTVDQAIEDVDRGIIKIEKIKKTLTFNLFTYGLRNKGTKTLKIGRIPKDWKISSLFEIAKVRYGLGQPPLKKEKGIPMIRATNIKEGKIFLKNLLFIDPRDIPDSRNPYLKENDIIVVRSGAYTGDVAYITQEWEGSVAGYDLIITPSENINPKYLSLFLLSNKIQKRYFGTIKERSAQPHLNSHQLEMTPIVYPTLVEQNKVAEIISATDQKMELLQAKKEKLTSIKKGLMYDLLTGQKRLRLES